MKNFLKFLTAAALVLVVAVPAFSQSSPNFPPSGFIPTAAQWNSYFAGKQDVLGYTPVNKAGDTMTGRLVLPAPGTSAGFSLTPGSAPGTPTNGDVWTTSGGIFARINGVSAQLLTTGGTVTPAQGGTGISSYAAGDLIYATGTSTLARLTVGTSSQVLRGGSAPSWGAVDLAAAVTGVLPTTNGGLGVNNGAATGMPVFTGGVAAVTANPSVGSLGLTGTSMPTTGIYQPSTNNLGLSANSTLVFVVTQTDIRASNASGPRISNSAPSATVPSIIPNQASPTSGIGADVSGDVSAIIGGAEVARITPTGINNAAVGATTPASGAFTTLQATAISGSTQCLQANSSGVVSGTGASCASSAVMTPTLLTTGTAATFTTPVGARQLVIFLRGAGGGGGAVSTSSGGNGATGGDTIFNSIHAAGGGGGDAVNYGGIGGHGGTGTTNVFQRFPGENGQQTAVQIWPGGNMQIAGGFGGGGGGVSTSSGSGGGGGAAVASSGAGGGGASTGQTSLVTLATFVSVGGGGGQGEGVLMVINSPAASYTYTIGAGGAAGTGTGFNGAAGAGGNIAVYAYF